jgi:hypothetical protein
MTGWVNADECRVEDRTKKVSTACKSPGIDCHQWLEEVACVQLLRTGTEEWGQIGGQDTYVQVPWEALSF